MLTVRAATAADLPTLTTAWHEAALWRPEQASARPSVDEALRLPDLARYRWDPTDPDQVAVVATVGDRGVGGAWTIRFPADAPGYGYVDASTAELGIGVDRAWHRRGIGRTLLSALLVECRLRGHTQLSLSVEADNPSRHLYAELGFRKVGAEPDGSAVTMLRQLSMP